MGPLCLAPGQLYDRSSTALVEDPVVDTTSDDPKHLLLRKSGGGRVGEVGEVGKLFLVAFSFFVFFLWFLWCFYVFLVSMCFLEILMFVGSSRLLVAGLWVF